MTRWLLVLAFAASSGCAVISSDTKSGDAQTTLTVQVREQPPAEKEADPKEKPAAPGYGYIWVAGYWDYLDGVYVWRDGRWVPGKPAYEYVRARYEFDGKSWVFHRPHWKKRHTENAQAGTQPSG
jgi:hypothetical protein